MRLSKDFNADALYEGLLDSLSEIRIEKKKDESTYKAWGELLKFMDPEHIRIIFDEFKVARSARENGKNYHINALAQAAALLISLNLVNSQNNGNPPPLTLPAHVADVYLSEPGSFPIKNCPNCFYIYPMYFDHCPLCESNAAC